MTKMIATSPTTRLLLFRIWSHLTRRRKTQLFLLLFLIIVSALAELLSLGTVLPFLAVLSNPQQTWENPVIQSLGQGFGFTNALDLVWPATILFVTASVISTIIKLINLRVNGKLSALIGAEISRDAYIRTIHQPYEVHVQRNSSIVIATIMQHIDLTVVAINAFLQVVTFSFISSGLIISLLLIDYRISIASILFFGFAYTILAAISRRELRSNGKKITQATSRQLQILQESLGAIRDVLLNGSQVVYSDAYQKQDRTRWYLQAKNAFLGTFPRYALESVGMIFIAFLGATLATGSGDGREIIPVVGSFALGSQRLLPSLQQIYSGWASLKARNSSMIEVLSLLDQKVLLQKEKQTESLKMKDTLRFSSVDFTYSSSKTVVLHDINMEICRGECIGIIGTTGSGKSTLIDLLMGLLPPTKGKVLVDNQNIWSSGYSSKVLSWQASISHVPQNIYLSDCSLAENIAFCIPPSEIDMDRVKRAAKQAQIASFIEDGLGGYNAFVGERGIRLSGGQKQRIGIARALYRKTSVLVLDEATSALDAETESAVIQAIKELDHELTIIMIAHRLRTLETCNKIIKIENGTAYECSK